MGDTFDDRVTRHVERRGSGPVYPPSEKAFYSYAEKRGLQYFRYGFDEQNAPVPTSEWMRVPKTIRMQPDLIVVGGQGPVFVEIKGFNGKSSPNRMLKLKQTNIEEYYYWSRLLPVWIYAYDNVCRTGILIPDNVWKSMVCDEWTKVGRYSDNNEPYYGIELPVYLDHFDDTVVMTEWPVPVKKN